VFNGTDGNLPYAELVQATNGRLYGTTEEGGANGLGTVFEITANGALTTILSFNDVNGATPVAALVEGKNALYGTTYYGGASGDGTVFQITAGGILTTLHSFDIADGESPYAALVRATDGTFYGTTFDGGTSGDGTVFSLSVDLSAIAEP
jgi:uncharacterized repeat protein (TIGR03803 family)